MTAPATMLINACASENIQQDGSCTVPVLLPYHQPVMPHLTLEEGTQVAFAIVGCWALGVVAGMIYKAANQSQA